MLGLVSLLACARKKSLPREREVEVAGLERAAGWRIRVHLQLDADHPGWPRGRAVLQLEEVADRVVLEKGRADRLIDTGAIDELDVVAVGGQP
jgi:hypothetical protein